MGCHPFNRFNTSPFVCLSKARTWIFNAICRCLVFGVQWFEVRGDCLLCWLVELLAITVYFLFIIAYNSIQVCFFILFLLVLQSSKLHRTKMNSRNYSYEYRIRKKTTSFLNKCSILVQFKVWQVFHYLVKLVPEEYTYHYSFLTYGSRQWLTSRFRLFNFYKAKRRKRKMDAPGFNSIHHCSLIFFMCSFCFQY